MANLRHYNQKSIFGADMFLAELLTPEDLCTTIRDKIAPLVKDSDFEDMYKEGGRSPISPRILILTMIMQFIERLSDRDAVKNLKFRLDWKIAFGLELDFLGFHPTLLVYFRDRLLESEKATYAFDKIIEHLTESGLIKKNAKQRIDSTHIIGCIQELSRIDLLHESLRLFCEDIVQYKSLMNEQLSEGVERYIEEIPTRGISDAERNKLVKEAGQTMKVFLVWGSLPNTPEEVKKLKSYHTLKVVFEQNFNDGDGTDPELKKVSTGKDHVCSPHEPEARYSNKGGKGWLGYKGEVVESVGGSDDVNFITHIDIIEATDHDGVSVPDIIDDLKGKEIEPSELYGDTHYNTSANIEDLEEQGIELKGPVAPASKKETKEKNRGFDICIEEQKVICPQGNESKRFNCWQDGRIHAVFPQDKCAVCDQREICVPEPRGRCFEARPVNQTLASRREKMRDPAYKEDLHKRNGIEGTISGLVRGQNWRRSRYRGKGKVRLQAKFTGAAVNVIRLHRKLVNDISIIREKADLIAA